MQIRRRKDIRGKGCQWKKEETRRRDTMVNNVIWEEIEFEKAKRGKKKRSTTIKE